MSLCNFSELDNVTLEAARESIRRYAQKNGLWVRQFNMFFQSIRKIASPEKRTVVLLSIVRDNGWNMNRRGQCAHILEEVSSERISRGSLEAFWGIVDDLPNVTLRDLPSVSRPLLEQLEASLGSIRKTLRSWHPSSDTLCFLTKVVLMFNWGQSPAFDTRVRSALKLPNDLSTEELVEALIEMGVWICDFESRNGVMLDQLATSEIRETNEASLGQLPLGRGLDMLLFSMDRPRQQKTT